MIKLSDLSDKLYDHPFTVTNATKLIESNLISMHRYMKDVALSKNEEELNRAINQVNQSEIVVYKEFDIVFERYLGDKNDIQKSYDSFVNWKPIRDKVIFLVKNGQHDEAAQITKSIGAQHVKLLNSHVDKLINYAQNKAIFFLDNVHESKKQAIILVAAIIGAILFIVASMMVFLLINLNRNDKKTKEYFHLIDQNIMSVDLTKTMKIQSISNAFVRFSGFSKEDLLGEQSDILYSNDNEQNIEELINAIQSGKPWSCEIKIETSFGEIKWLDSQVHPKFDENYNVIGYSNILIDISSKKQIEEISRHDGLTNLYNRRFFDEEFSRQLNVAQRNKLTLAFILIDVDAFKSYNDTYGHHLGDIALKTIATVLKSSIKRSNDYSFRLGGEEFGMLFSVKEDKDAQTIAEKTVQGVESLSIEHINNPASSFITISLGVCLIHPNTLLTVEEIYKLTDDALYKSKNNGRNQISLVEC